MKNTNFNFLDGLMSLQEANNHRLDNSSDLDLKIDDNIRFEFSDALIDYLIKVRDDPMYDGEVTIARFKNDIKRILGNEATEIINLFIFLDIINDKIKIKIA